jgi:hypothetical protein
MSVDRQMVRSLSIAAQGAHVRRVIHVTPTPCTRMVPIQDRGELIHVLNICRVDPVTGTDTGDWT